MKNVSSKQAYEWVKTGHWNFAQFNEWNSAHSEMARLAKYDEMLTAQMPADFKDWHENSKNEWPELSAFVVSNLREQLADANKEIDNLYTRISKITRSTYTM